MKTIITALLAGAVCALSSFALAKEKKEGSKTSDKTTTVAATAEHKILAPADITWGEAPPAFPAGAKLAVLDGDPGKKASFTVRLQAPDGYKIAPHTHPAAELVTVISGTLHLGMGDKFDESAAREMTPGSFAVMPAGMKHFAWFTGETVVQINAMGPFEIKYVNQADDPRQAKK